MRVAALLEGERGIGDSESERLSAADRFIQRLGDLSGAARDSLLSGQMSDDDLASRVKVFAADVRAESSVVAVDPSIAASAPDCRYAS